MKSSHEGEIIVKEKYGSTSREVLYVNPPSQENIVALATDRSANVTSWFTKIFLPQGYPDSVSKDYIAYQFWDTAQAFCSTITGTLATQEVLRGVGVGSTSATPLAATVTWVIKDGCGHLGRIVFAFSHGTYLDAYSKKWRLFADILNDAAMCMEIALPLFNNYTTLVLCISTMMKAIVGVAGGATRAAMTQHHAERGNLADVSAKDSAQETAVNLVASFSALGIIALFGNSLAVFALMVLLHIAFNYMAVRAVCLRTLNEPRLLRVIDLYLRREQVAAPPAVNAEEPIVFYRSGPNLLDLKLCGFRIQLGASIKKLVSSYPKAEYLKTIKNAYKDRKYILWPHGSAREMYVALKEGAQAEDVLCAYFHAVLLAKGVRALCGELESAPESSWAQPFAQLFCSAQMEQMARTAKWRREPAAALRPSADLLAHVDAIVAKEWIRLRNGLKQTGWDLSKHLLIVDEWRVCTKEFQENPIMAGAR